jgi:hypothetical protein
MLTVLGLVGCGGTSRMDDAATATPDAPASVPDAPSGGPDAAGGATTPDAPVLMSAMMVTHGTNALAWSLPASGCDMVQIHRNLDGGTYAVVETLAGTTTEAENFSGHGSGTFCYTVSCVLGGATSEPSNERCITQ